VGLLRIGGGGLGIQKRRGGLMLRRRRSWRVWGGLRRWVCRSTIIYDNASSTLWFVFYLCSICVIICGMAFASLLCVEREINTMGKMSS